MSNSWVIHDAISVVRDKSSELLMFEKSRKKWRRLSPVISYQLVIRPEFVTDQFERQNNKQPAFECVSESRETPFL